MDVKFLQIVEMFDKVIANSISREHASDWAYNLQMLNDKGNLDFNPPNEENKILKGIFYLIGIDLKDSPSSYLHELNDIIDFKNKMIS